MEFMALEIITILYCLNDHKTKANYPLRKRLSKIYREIRKTNHDPRVWLTKWEARQSIHALKQSRMYDKLSHRGKVGWKLMYKMLRTVGNSTAKMLKTVLSQLNHDISMAKHNFTKEASENVFRSEYLAQITQAYFGYNLKTLESFSSTKLINFLKELKKTLIKLSK